MVESAVEQNTARKRVGSSGAGTRMFSAEIGKFKENLTEKVTSEDGRE